MAKVLSCARVFPSFLGCRMNGFALAFGGGQPEHILDLAVDRAQFLDAFDGVDGFFEGKRYLIHDRDPLYTQEFLSMLGEAGIESVALPPRAPNLNAYRSGS